MKKINVTPKEIFAEFKKGSDYKSSIGDEGIYEQSKINERFFVGDQWYGANISNKRPLVRRNVIKRIGDYKMAMITAAPISVNYSAEGVTHIVSMQEEEKAIRQQMMKGSEFSGETTPIEIAAITSALSDYFKITAERVKFDLKKEEMLRNAYISGTGIMYTYWDKDIKTGLYADQKKTSEILGDIQIEVLDVENVNFGDPNNDDIQSQPYIDIAQRMTVDQVKREAKANGLSADNIAADLSSEYNAGTRGEKEPDDSKRTTVITRLYKEYDKNGRYKVMAVKVTENATIREPWDTKISLYPIAKFCWERRRSCAYGDSEITYLIPNQIAINRALTAAVWGMMQSGMPIMVVNGDTIPGEISNNPGQVIKIYGSNEDVQNSIRYVNPPNIAGQYETLVNDLSSNTLGDAGATDSALGNVRPDNASAIIQMREAATQPMQIYMNRFYAFVEDIARIWQDMWLNCYGQRSLKVVDKDGTWYAPFNPERYKNLLLTARVDVGASTLWGDSIVIGTLDSLLNAGVITAQQYFERLPKGLIPDLTGLIEENKLSQAAAIPTNPPTDDTTTENTPSDDIMAQFKSQYPEEYEQFMQLPPEQQAQTLQEMGITQ